MQTPYRKRVDRNPVECHDIEKQEHLERTDLRQGGFVANPESGDPKSES